MQGFVIPAEVELAVNMDRREITAYAAIFGNIDRQGHRIMHGAFDNSVRSGRIEKGEVKLFRDHEINVGVVTKAEPDSRGLLTVGYVSKTRDGDETLEKAADKSISHYSFAGPIMPGRARWVVEKGSDGADQHILNLSEIMLRECGPCMNKWPVNPDAAILAVKGMTVEQLDWLYELPYLVKSLTFGRNRLSGEDERIAKAALRVYDALGEDLDALKALLAPESSTSPARATPDKSTPADAEKSLDLAPLLESLRRRGQLAA